MPSETASYFGQLAGYFPPELFKPSIALIKIEHLSQSKFLIDAVDKYLHQHKNFSETDLKRLVDYYEKNIPNKPKTWW